MKDKTSIIPDVDKRSDPSDLSTPDPLKAFNSTTVVYSMTAYIVSVKDR